VNQVELVDIWLGHLSDTGRFGVNLSAPTQGQHWQKTISG